MERERPVDCRETGRDQGEAFVRHRARRTIEREDPENRDRDLKQVDGVEPVTDDGVDGREHVRVERRLEEDLGAEPLTVGDLLRPPVVLLAVHRQLGEERLVVDGGEMREADGERHEEDCGEDESAAFRGHAADYAAYTVGAEVTMSILELFGWRSKPETQAPPASSADTETVRKIAAELDRLDPEKARYIAAFAYILSRVARADLHISEEELRKMEQIVQEKGGLPEEQAVMVVQMAKTQSILFGGVENFLVTREFDKIATREQKIALLHCLFGVSAADNSISSAEDTTIRSIADELHLDHSEFIAVKSAYGSLLATRSRTDETP